MTSVNLGTKEPRHEDEASKWTGRESASTLVNRNVTIAGRRTSMRLEQTMWDALWEICQRENLTRHELCENIDKFRHASSLTAAIRVFVVNYFRAAATEEGHANNNHGTLYRTET